jgi:superfamily II DNA or RNA helicase
MGDFVNSELVNAMDKPTITGSAVEHYMKLTPNKKAIVFCCSIEHSKNVTQQFINAGISAEHLDGGVDDSQRHDAIRRFREGQTNILSSIEIFSEGLDVPSVEVSILLRPTQSLSLYIQQTGRALRISDNKTQAVILDHAGNTVRHGFPDDDREWSLQGVEQVNSGRAQSEVPPVKICKQCFAANSGFSVACNYCHAVFEVKQRDIKFVEGELKELTRQAAIKNRKVEQGKAQELEDLVELGRQRGYARPRLWAQYIYRARLAKRRSD